MQLEFVDRKTYRLRHDKSYLDELQLKYPDAVIVPEGGTNDLALKGVFETCNEIIEQSHLPINHIFTATGSGGTIAGVIAGFSLKGLSNLKVTGIAVLKQAEYLNDVVSILVKNAGINAEQCIDWQLNTDFHQGGYAKVSPKLKSFCDEFTKQTNIPLEPIYTGKMFFALFQLIEQGYFKKGDNIIAIHTGGLQGNAGLISK